MTASDGEATACMHVLPASKKGCNSFPIHLPAILILCTKYSVSLITIKGISAIIELSEKKAPMVSV